MQHLFKLFVGVSVAAAAFLGATVRQVSLRRTESSHYYYYYYYYYYKSKDYSDTITQKRCTGTLQSSKCDADAPKYGARTFTLLVSIQTS